MGKKSFLLKKILILAKTARRHLKKLTAISLLILFIFNTIGYRLVLDFVQNKTDEAFEAKLDRGYYNDDELVAIKIPINLPYQNNWAGYERVDGEISFEGKVYKYVKRTVQNDTMILLCIPHEEKTKIQETANNYFGGVNDLAGNNNNNKKAEAFKQLMNEFESLQQAQSFEINPSESFFQLYNSAACLQQIIPLHGQPPDTSC